MTWRTKLKYILAETENIHRFYSSEEGWCYLTDVRGQRYRINETMTLTEISSIIEKIKTVKSYGYASRRI